MPAVVVGLAVYMLLSRNGPMGALRLLALTLESALMFFQSKGEITP